jgi:hypothetical protein
MSYRMIEMKLICFICSFFQWYLSITMICSITLEEIKLNIEVFYYWLIWIWLTNSSSIFVKMMEEILSVKWNKILYIYSSHSDHYFISYAIFVIYKNNIFAFSFCDYNEKKKNSFQIHRKPFMWGKSQLLSHHFFVNNILI